MPNICEALKILYPKGRALDSFHGTVPDNLNKAFCQEPERIKTYFDNIKLAGIPGYIPDEYLSDWENFLGLESDSSLTNEQRQSRITGRYTAVGGQGKDYIQRTIRNAGFTNAYVLENNPSEGAADYLCVMGEFTMGDGISMGAYSDRIDPRELTGTLIAGSPDYTLERRYSVYMGETDMCEEMYMGEYIGDYITETVYTIPAIANRFIFFWFICGASGVNEFIDIPIERKNDFIKLILQIKPAHTWCIAQVNWI